MQHAIALSYACKRAQARVRAALLAWWAFLAGFLKSLYSCLCVPLAAPALLGQGVLRPVVRISMPVLHVLEAQIEEVSHVGVKERPLHIL